MRKKKIRIIAAALCALSISFIQANASQVKLQSNNNRVIASDKSVAVFSSTMRPISSSVLTDALSADGYTIKYVNSKLNQAAVSDVRGGYILAEKNSQSTYIPIVTRSEDIISEDFSAKDKLIFTEYNNGGSGIVTSLAGGLASKSADDKSYLLAADGSTSAGSNGSYLQYSNPFSADTVYTMEVSVLNNSDGKINIRSKTGSTYLDFFFYKPDGSVSALNLADGNNKQVTAAKTYDVGAWHKVAFTVDTARSRCYTYIDGELVGDLWINLSSAPAFDYFQLRLWNNDGNSTVCGDAAFDDFEIYKGYYDSERKSMSASSDKAYIDENSNSVCGLIGRSVSQAEEMLTTGGMIRVADENGAIKSASMIIEPTDEIWLCDSDGNYNKTYTIDEVNFISDINLEQSGDELRARLTVCPAKNGEDMSTVIAAAQYENGTLTALSMSPDTKYSEKSVLSISSKLSDAQTKIFVLDGMDILKPLTKAYKIGSSTLANIDFESERMSQLVLNQNSNLFERVKESDENYIYHLKSNNTGGSHISISGLYTESDYAVYETDIKILSANSAIAVYQKDSAGNTQDLANIKNMQFLSSSGETIAMDMQWHRMSFVSDYRSRKISVYYDSKYVGSINMKQDYAKGSDRAEIFRLQTLVGSEFEFNIDNFRAYEGMTLKDDIGSKKNKIDLSVTRSVFESEDAQKELLADCMTLHTRSGVVYDGNGKSIMENKPVVDSNGDVTVDAAELSEKLGLPQTGESGYITLAKWAELSQKTLTFVDSKYNSGLVVIGDKEFEVPESDESVAKLNAYAFNLRPGRTQIEKAYKNSPQYGQHPRIMATKSDFDRIRSESLTDSSIKALRNIIIADADDLLDEPALGYTLHEISDLLPIARAMSGRINILAMAYQLTGDAKYANRCRAEMESAANFPDWYPQAHLNPCEMGYAVAIGYDWIYDALSEDERKTIEEAMYDKLFYPAWEAYLSTGSSMTNGVVSGNNHTIICNAGIGLAAMTMLDVYPDECGYLVSNAIRGIDDEIYKFAPEGAWYEGVSYWEYAMSYSIKMLSSLMTNFGTDFGYTSTEGLKEATDYLPYMMAPRIGLFNYSDSTPGSIWSPEILWLANEYNRPQIAAVYQKLAYAPERTTDFYYGGFAMEDKVLRLLWSKPESAGDTETLALDRLYKNEGAITLRNDWSTYPTFLGIHGGRPDASHGHLDAGSFIFDSGSRRWSMDTGMGNYSSEGYWDNSVNGTRWKHFPTRAEAHSTIVINPDSGPDQAPDSYADVKLLESTDKAAIVTVDMSDVLRYNVNSATRGFFFTDNRKSLVVRDEIDLKKDNSEIYWFMMANANVTIESQTDTGCVLKYLGVRMKLDFATDADSAEISLGEAKPLATSPVMSDDPSTSNYKRFAIKMTGSGKVNITVKLTPYPLSGKSDISDYNKPVGEWHID